MITAKRATWLCLVSCFVLAPAFAWGQSFSAESEDQVGIQRSTPAMRYFGRGRQVAVPKTRSRRPAPPIRPVQLAASKPFQHIHRGPSVTPYLSLDTLESANGVPNYYSRVLPQIQQLEDSQAQVTQLRRLQQQVRLARNPGQVATTRNGGVPTTGHSSQFLNNGGYFPMMR